MAPFFAAAESDGTAVPGASVAGDQGAVGVPAHARCPGFRRISGPLLGMCVRCALFGDSPAMPPAVAFRSGVPDCPSFTPI